MPMLIADVAANGNVIKDFVDGVANGVTSNITLTEVGTVVAGIIAAGIVSIFAWKFARKGYAFVKNALSGKAGKV